MLQFVKQWVREITDEKTIVADGTRDKWTSCEDGLPHTDRYVEVLLYGSNSRYELGKNVMLTLARFNPRVGWNIDGCVGIVISWRDIDKEIKNILDDHEYLKKLI
jgi:hypothetical protein